MNPAPWLLLAHQIPAHPSNLRVRVWRKLQNLGAVPIKNSLYALPDRPSTREDFDWLRQEIVSLGGEASVFSGDAVSAAESGDLVAAFRKARAKDFALFAREAVAVRKQAERILAAGRPDADALARLGRRWAVRKAELDRLLRIDFFAAPNRDEARRAAGVVSGLFARAMSAKAAPTSPSRISPASLKGRTWVTRRSPHIDRLASGWLVRRFVDPKARFKFVAEPYEPAAGELCYDMAGGEFTHHGDWCTFETLVHRLGLADPALSELAEIVHDIDLKDGKFGRAEAAGVALALEGLTLRHGDDDGRLEAGLAFFAGLHAALGGGKR